MKKNLPENELLAIEEYKRKIREKFGVADIILFGSKARGEGDVYSDIDILVILDRDVDTSTEEELFDIGFEIELKYDVVFGVVVYSKRFWNALGKVMPLYKNIKKEGIKV